LRRTTPCCLWSLMQLHNMALLLLLALLSTLLLLLLLVA
jgi:hypothetical protein